LLEKLQVKRREGKPGGHFIAHFSFFSAMGAGSGELWSSWEKSGILRISPSPNKRTIGGKGDNELSQKGIVT